MKTLLIRVIYLMYKIKSNKNYLKEFYLKNKDKFSLSKLNTIY